MATERLSKTDYHFSFAETAARRSTCPRAAVGCVLIRDGAVIATGYNGALAGARHCDHSLREFYPDREGIVPPMRVEGDVEHDHCSNAVHAEANAVAYAARAGVSLEGADAYLTHAPCRVCWHLLRAAGVSSIYFRNAYRLHPRVAEDARCIHVPKEEPCNP